MPSRLSRPTPCSPVTVPPSAIAVGQDLLERRAAPSRRAATSSGGTMISGCRLPSPACAMVAICTPCRSAIASIDASIAGTCDRGTQTSSVSTGPSRSSAGYASRRAANSASASTASVTRLGPQRAGGRERRRPARPPPRRRTTPGVSTCASSSASASAPARGASSPRRPAGSDRSSSSSTAGTSPLRVHAATATPGVEQAVERADHRARRLGARRPQPQRHLGDRRRACPPTRRTARPGRSR